MVQTITIYTVFISGPIFQAKTGHLAEKIKIENFKLDFPLGFDVSNNDLGKIRWVNHQ